MNERAEETRDRDEPPTARPDGEPGWAAGTEGSDIAAQPSAAVERGDVPPTAGRPEADDEELPPQQRGSSPVPREEGPDKP